MSAEQYDLGTDDTRFNFYESWISESPQRTRPRNDLNGIIQDIIAFSEYYDEKKLSNGLYQLETSDKIFIYGKDNDKIIIAAEFEHKGQNLSVISNAKSDTYIGKSPFMSDVYLTALAISNGKSIKFQSDKTLTDAGFDVWARLLQSGHVISVYDTSQSGQTMKVINTVAELKHFWDYPIDFSKYRFVLSENKKHWLDTVYSPFSTRRLRELANITLDELYGDNK
jgi:hypothetical protein